jgi:dipeptidyl-peptidase-4
MFLDLGRAACLPGWGRSKDCEMRKFLYLLSFLVCSAAVAAGGNSQLTIERIFDSPELDGPKLMGLQFSPSGKRLTYLQPKKDNYEILDLWEFDLGTGTPRLLVDSNKLKFGELSEQEKARRERMRMSRKGIVEYYISEIGDKIVFPAGGDLYLHDFEHPLKRLTKNESAEIDVRFSPKDTYVSFTRDQNLYVIDLASGKETPVTREGKGDISYGSAEFIAQEEMGRQTGYWWSKDEKFLAFTEVDESGVKLVDRYEIGASGVTTRKQRYPEAGSANAKVRLGIVALGAAFTGTAKATWISLGSNDDIYLPRVDWTEDGKLAYEIQSRDQKTLDVYLYDPKTSRSQKILRETNPHWVDLGDDWYWLKRSNDWIWGSERSGYKHLYLMDRKGKVIRQLTHGHYPVAFQGVDEEGGWVYYTANEPTPLNCGLYRVSIAKAGTPEQILKEEGCAWIAMDKDAKRFIRYASTPMTPTKTTLHKASGEVIATLLANEVDSKHPLYPYWNSLRVPEYGSFKGPSGDEIYYSIIKPKNFIPKKKYPLIVTGYGGPGARVVGKWWRGRGTLFEQVLAGKGFIVASFDNRGSSGRGRKFEDWFYRKFGVVEVEDQKAGVDYLVRQGFVDPKRVGFFGWSYGGYLAMMLLAKAPDTFKANVAVAPVSDFALYDTHYTERYLGKPQENKKAYHDANVLNFVPQIQGRALIVHGMADDNVLFTNSTMLFQKMQESGKLYESVTYPGQKHGIYGKANQIHVHRTILDFFERYLKD